MTDADNKRLSAHWFGEALRETAVLIVVFVPLDWSMGRHERKFSGALIAFLSPRSFSSAAASKSVTKENGGKKMMESLMASDATPFLLILLFAGAGFIFMMYYTRELRELPSKPAASAKKKRRPAVAR